MCIECRQTPCHPRCPNASESKFKHYCYDCDEGIYTGDEYVENLSGDMMHYHCCCGLTTRELIKWLGFEIEEMKECD
jgi:hypothetical protein